MQREKRYELQRTTIIRLGNEGTKSSFTKKYLIFAASKSGRSEFRSFSKQKKCNYKITGPS